MGEVQDRSPSGICASRARMRGKLVCFAGSLLSAAWYFATDLHLFRYVAVCVAVMGMSIGSTVRRLGRMEKTSKDLERHAEECVCTGLRQLSGKFSTARFTVLTCVGDLVDCSSGRMLHS